MRLHLPVEPARTTWNRLRGRAEFPGRGGGPRRRQKWRNRPRSREPFAARIGLVTEFVLGVVLGTVVATGHAAEPWSRWRGDEAAGRGGAGRVPPRWSERDWAWSAPLPGMGHASPVIWDGRVYTASADEAQRRRTVCCHSLADGTLVWERGFPGPVERHHAQNSSASGSVVADRTGVYWMWATADGIRVEALSHAGLPLWHADLGPFTGDHGFGATPAVCRDLLIVPNDQEGRSFVVAFDTLSGREVWRLPRESSPKTGYATPLVLDRGDDAPLAVLASMAHGLTGIDPLTGRVLWERRCFPRRTVSSPVSAGPLVLGTCGEGGGDNTLVAVRLPGMRRERGDAIEPDIAFTLDRSVAPYVPLPLCVGGRIYLWGDRGVVTCIAADTGGELWRGRAGGTFAASPVAVGDSVVNVSADGDVVVLRDGDAFELLGRTPLGEECRATPAVAGGRIVFRTVGHLRGLDIGPRAGNGQSP